MFMGDRAIVNICELLLTLTYHWKIMGMLFPTNNVYGLWMAMG